MNLSKAQGKTISDDSVQRRCLTYDAIEQARDRAARHAEFDLGAYTLTGLECELALDTLAAFVDSIDRIMFVQAERQGDKRALAEKGLADPGRRLAWALSLTDARNDLKPHEARLLADAWARVVELGEDQKWERMGHGG